MPEEPEAEAPAADELLLHLIGDRFGGDGVVGEVDVEGLSGVAPLHGRDGVGVFGQHSVFGHGFPSGVGFVMRNA